MRKLLKKRSTTALTLLCQIVSLDSSRSANMSGYNSRAIYRFKQRHISLLDFPSAVLRSTYARVLGSLRIRTIATVHMVLFAVRFPPLFSLCRTTFPDEAGSGFTPQSAANADSLRKRSGLSPATDNNVAAVCGPTPNCFRSRFAVLTSMQKRGYLRVP